MMRLVGTRAGPWTQLKDLDHFGKNDLLHVCDVFDENTLSDIFSQKGLPQCVFQDSYTFYTGDFSCDFWCVDIWLGQHLRLFRDVAPRPLRDTHTANFLINKKQINRFLTIKFVELFNIDCGYTWSGVDNQFDMTDIIRELDSLGPKDPLSAETRSFILTPITTPPKWIDAPLQNKTSSGISAYGGNRWAWENGIGDTVAGSAVSLISESVKFEKAMHFSEKTAYAMLGQTFPIWIGGFRQAEEWEKLGFDVFHDIIDHSYQYHETLIERCWYAFANNRSILSDRALAHDLRYQARDRLDRNFQKIIDNVLLEKNKEIIASWPDHIRETIRPALEKMAPDHL